MQAAHVCANLRLHEQSLAEMSSEGSSVKALTGGCSRFLCSVFGKFTHISSSIIEVIWNLHKKNNNKAHYINPLPK